jgi:hypothetical protein
MTSNQSVGFLARDPKQKEITKMDMYPKGACNETKFADEMIRTGIHFS